MALVKRRKRLITFIVGIVLFFAVAAGIVFMARRNNDKIPAVPSAVVKSGDFIDSIELRGEITVRSSTVIAAPYNAGDNLQILKLAPNGTQVKKGDIVVQFDASSLQRTADTARAALRQVEAEIAKANAQQRLSEEQILTEVMSAKFGLERARLDASTRDVVPAIENEKNVLALGKAEQKLKELDVKMQSRRVGTEADLAGIFRRRDKAKADLQQAENNSAALTLLSPMDGIITMLPNSRARTQLLGGGSAPLFKEGDRCYAGASIAEIPDLSTIQGKAPLSEADRGRVQQGQPVILNIEAIPDREHKGVISDISSLAKVDYSNYPIKKSFDIAVKLENPDPKLRPGMTATLRVEVERIRDSIVIPAEAVFQKNGQTVAYVFSDKNYRERPLTLARRGSGQVMILRGLKPGERVALKDPTVEEQK